MDDKQRAETWKRLWKEERARHEKLIAAAVSAKGQTPAEIAELVIKEWCEVGDKRTQRDLMRRALEIALLPLPDESQSTAPHKAPELTPEFAARVDEFMARAPTPTSDAI